MGQFPSRLKRIPEHLSTQHTASSSNTPLPTDLLDEPEAPSRTPRPIKQSRRSTLRRSIIGLVAPSSTSKHSDETTEQALSDRDLSHSTSRKRWRTSKRWSRALSTRATGDMPSVDSAANNGKGKGRETEPALEDSEAQSSSSLQTQVHPVPWPTTSELLSDSLSESGAIHDEGRLANILDNEEQLPPSSPSDLDPPLAIQHNDVSVEEPQPATPAVSLPIDQSLATPPPRHFPPPGTLVVVQGVVNTTDTGSTSSPNNINTSNTTTTSSVIQSPTSRPNSSLFPTAPRRSRSSTPTGDRFTNRSGHRISSIIRRPTSIFNDNRRSSAVLDNDTATDTSSSVVEPSTETSTSSGDSSSPNDLSSATTVESDNDIQSQHQRPLSPGSIDVLGTLLSVAAAATAASLFSPNSFSARNSNSSPESDGNRPTSPTPTAGLGVNGFGPLDTLAGLGFPMERESQPLPTNIGVASGPGGHNVNRDRLRGAWDTLRDRLGLHNARANGTDDEFQPADENRGDGVRGGSTGPSDTMISEMARALGTGLGLQEDGGQGRAASDHRTSGPAAGGVTDPPPVGTAASSSSPLPAEGSFERFLFNLQADLRAVLSEDSSPDPAIATTDAATPPATDAEATEGSSPSQNQEEGREPPALRDENEIVTVEEAGQNVGVDAPPAPEPSPDAHVPPLNHDRRAGGGINLWRSYRFPPIVAPSRPSPLYQPGSSLPGSSALPAGVISDPAPAYTPPSRSENEGVSAAAPEPISSTTPLLPEIPALDIVVPVIIVGLQSVNVDNRGDQQHDEHESIFTRPDSTADVPEREGIASVGGIPTEERPTTPRGRPWHSRAANALRNLRPGRRPGMATTGTNDRNASRTFLIYVIGGYYPPNHHIVTGTDGMDSYEALWELAALLGQVKPPVATPEDIENSGLQIIKPSEIELYARDGQVASNCIDRCLICLDDYEPEEDLRVMSCKHFFHKTCVDKWLQIGRNNCPACRTKGVSTHSDTEPSLPPQPTSPATPVA